MARASVGVGDQFPLFAPRSDWKRPRELPDLRGRPVVALDTEEFDGGLTAGRGPGWAIRNGRMLGLSWATDDGECGYAPMGHPETENFDKGVVADWLRSLVKSGTRLLFQNAPYDCGWMHADLGVTLPHRYPMDDLLCAAFMINENEYEYNLDAICTRLGIPGKDTELMHEAAAAYLRPANAPRSWKLTRKEMMSNLHLLPAKYVGPYAENDAMKTLRAFQMLEPALSEQQLEKAYRLEMNIVPVVMRMKARGIRIDVDHVLRMKKQFKGQLDDLIVELRRRLPGRGPGGAPLVVEHLRSARTLDPIFFDEGIDVPRTDKDNASYKQKWMEVHPHWLPKLVSRALKIDRFINVFLGEYIQLFMNAGRIHAEAHQYKSDDGGTVSYRFAYSDPPLQQAPSPDRDIELGMAFRSCFVADDGAVWGANDYSQQEYRLTAHFAAAARVRGGAQAAKQFTDDPNLDFHQMVAQLTGLTRDRAKIQNFALLYGQGRDTTAAALSMSLEDADKIREQVAAKAPFGPALDEFARNRASSLGFLRLLDGARVRFDEWEGGWLEKEEFQRGLDEKLPMEPCSLEEAKRRKADPRHPWHKTRIRRSGVRKALNRLIQGSAARQTKMAIDACAAENLIPVLQMHDELDHVEDSPAKIQRVAQIMRTVVPLKVPMLVDTGIDKSWGMAKMGDKLRKKAKEGNAAAARALASIKTRS